MNSEDRSQLELLRVEMVGRMNVMQKDIDDIKSTVKEKLADHEARIRSTERWKLSIPISALIAIATVVGGILGRGGH